MLQRRNTSEFTVSGHSHLLCGEFPGPFWCEGLLLVFNKCCVRIAPCRCVLNVLVRRGEFLILLLCHLDSSPQKRHLCKKNQVVLAVFVTLAPIVIILLKSHSSCCRDFKKATISITVIRSTVDIIY